MNEEDSERDLRKKKRRKEGEEEEMRLTAALPARMRACPCNSRAIGVGRLPFEESRPATLGIKTSYCCHCFAPRPSTFAVDYINLVNLVSCATRHSNTTVRAVRS